jgi:hypothetical protein
VLYNAVVYPHHYSILNEFYDPQLDIEIPTLSIQYLYVICLVAYETVAWYAGIFIAIFTLQQSDHSSPPLYQTVSSLIVSSFGYNSNLINQEVYTYYHDYMDA